MCLKSLQDFDLILFPLMTLLTQVVSMANWKLFHFSGATPMFVITLSFSADKHYPNKMNPGLDLCIFRSDSFLSHITNTTTDSFSHNLFLLVNIYAFS